MSLVAQLDDEFRREVQRIRSAAPIAKEHDLAASAKRRRASLREFQNAIDQGSGERLLHASAFL